MRVLKKGDIIPEVAQDLGLDEDIVRIAVGAYWKELITSVRDLKHLNILVHEIGEMRVVRSRLEQIEENMRRYMSRYDSESIQYTSVAAKIEKIGELKKLRDLEYQKRNGVKQRRKEYDKAKKDLDEQVEDS